MGIYDRDYYRREGPSYLGAFVEQGYVCKWLIGINVVAFVVQLITRPAADLPGFASGFGWVTGTFELNVSEVVHGQVWRLLTYAFLHDPNDLMHILFNMLFLWWFGKDVESIYGRLEFLAIYLVAALASGMAFMLAYYASMSKAQLCLGASGAVMAVLVLCALHFPRRIILLFFLVPVPIWLFVVFLVAQDMYGLWRQDESKRIAFSGHLAGAAFAFAYYKLQIRLVALWPRLVRWRRPQFRPRLRSLSG